MCLFKACESKKITHYKPATDGYSPYCFMCEEMTLPEEMTPVPSPLHLSWTLLPLNLSHSQLLFSICFPEDLNRHKNWAVSTETCKGSVSHEQKRGLGIRSPCAQSLATSFVLFDMVIYTNSLEAQSQMCSEIQRHFFFQSAFKGFVTHGVNCWCGPSALPTYLLGRLVDF